MTQKKLWELFQRNSIVEMLDAGDGTYQGKYPMDFQQFEEAAAEIRRQTLEEAAVTAWSTGMDLHMKEHDTREVGSKIARAIRALIPAEANERKPHDHD